jgi:hypothetical protein
MLALHIYIVSDTGDVVTTGQRNQEEGKRKREVNKYMTITSNWPTRKKKEIVNIHPQQDKPTKNIQARS